MWTRTIISSVKQFEVCIDNVYNNNVYGKNILYDEYWLLFE